MKFMNLAFFDELEQADNILLAGAGGGYDIFTATETTRSQTHAPSQVHLANLSLSYLPSAKTQQLSPYLLKVTPKTPLFANYFPEFYLSQWFEEQQGEEIPIYCFRKTGVKPLLDSYQALIKHLSIDTIILVDGGTDSMMRGDEVSLGTPIEDVTSIVAANELEIERRLLICLGFGVDSFHGICHAQFLEAVADLTQKGGYLGLFSLMQEMPEVQKYREALEYVFKAMPKDISIVSSSILSALSGHYGDYHAIPRTKGSQLWINPLMPVYWCFRLPQVAQRLLYPEDIKETEDFEEVITVIGEFRNECETIRAWETIPV